MDTVTERPESEKEPAAAAAPAEAAEEPAAKAEAAETAPSEASEGPAAGAKAPETAQPEGEARRPAATTSTEAQREPGARPEREPGPRPERKRRGRYTPRRKVCAFCVEKVEIIDYKDPGRLRRYVSDRGKMEPRRKTGTCAKHQRRLSIALKRARHLALLPYTAEHTRLTGVFAPRS